MLTGVISGDITASGESTCVMNGKVGGAVIVPAGVRFAAMNSTIGGAVVAQKGPAMTFLCGSTVSGSIDIDYAVELVMVGDRGALCAPNKSGGALILRYNQNGVEAIGNTIANLLTASNSGPGPYGQFTNISGNSLKNGK